MRRGKRIFAADLSKPVVPRPRSDRGPDAVEGGTGETQICGRGQKSRAAIAARRRVWNSKAELLLESERDRKGIGNLDGLTVVTAGLPLGHRTYEAESLFVESGVTAAGNLNVLD